MRILLDESVPRDLKGLLEDHEVKTVVEQGWASISNGELLERASGHFDVLVTADQQLPHQQDPSRYNVAVFVLVARTNSMVDYEPMADKLRSAVKDSKAGEVLWLTA